MYTIIGIQAKSTQVSPGCMGFDAQAEVLTAEGKMVYVDVNWFDELNGFFVADENVFAYLTGEIERNDELFNDHLMEVYSSIEEAQKSEYAGCFTMLDNIIYQMYHGPIIDQPGIELSEPSVVVEFNDWEDYAFLANRSFVDKGKKYIARICVSADDYYVYTIERDEKIVESYDDLDEAVKSKWFGVLCTLKHDLVEGMKDYVENHPRKGAKVKEILRRLYI